jgi:nifR3 family TIM-barrel protein
MAVRGRDLDDCGGGCEHDIKLGDRERKRKRSLLRKSFSHIIINAMDNSRSPTVPSGTHCLDVISRTHPGPRPAEERTGGGILDGVRLILAPLCGLTDAVFRKICLEHGADLAVSEMISSEGLVRNSPHIRAIRDLDMRAGPLALQIFGADPAAMAEAAAILSELRPRFIDLNFGCPVRKIVSKNGGSAVLKDLRLLSEICRRVVERSAVPVSAKIRTGWDKPTASGLRDIVRAIEDAGVSLLTVHARTKEQGFSGRADWALIRTVKESVAIPVVGNGDVTGRDSYRRMVETTGCDAVMIGRAAIGNPWVFEDIKAAIAGETCVPPTPAERVEELLVHVRLAVESYGEPHGIVATRRMMAAYLKRIPNARDLRSKIMKCERTAELERILGAYLDGAVLPPPEARSRPPIRRGKERDSTWTKTL